MLKKKTPATIPATLHIQSLGEKIEFKLVYRNHSFDQWKQKAEEEGIRFMDLVLFLVDSWEAEYTLDAEGVLELESDRPGMLQTIVANWGSARTAELVKN